MKNVLPETELRLLTLKESWNTLPIRERESIIESYWNTALFEKNFLQSIIDKETLEGTFGNWISKGRCLKRDTLDSHIQFLFYNAFLTLNLYIAHKGNWDVLREDMKEISHILWKFGKGGYAFNLFKHIGKNSRERQKTLKEFHLSKRTAIEICPMCGGSFNVCHIKKHLKVCKAKNGQNNLRIA